MSEQQTEGLAGAEAWQALLLRLTAFPGLSDLGPPEGWWEDVVGQPPEQTTRRRGELQVVGPFETGQLVLTLDPARFDWRFVAVEDTMFVTADLSDVGLLSQSLEPFLDRMLAWMRKRPLEINRLAFGADLVLPAASHVAAYSQLSNYLQRINIDLEGASDFLYQINRTRASRSGIADLQINRLSKWSALKLSRGAFLSSGQEYSFPNLDRYYCRLEVDINTAPGIQGYLPPDKLPDVFQELVDLGTEISLRGDIA